VSEPADSLRVTFTPRAPGLRVASPPARPREECPHFKLAFASSYAGEPVRAAYRSAAANSRSAPPCGFPQHCQCGRVVLRGREGSQVRDEQRHILERRPLVLLEIEAEPSGRRSGRSGAAVSGRPVPTARGPRRSSRGRSPARSPRRGRGCRVRVPAGRSFEGGPARSTLLLSGAERHERV
jgi:hypothetical protein